MQRNSVTLSKHKPHLHVDIDQLLVLAFDTADCGGYKILIAVLSHRNTSILVMILHLTTSACIFVMIVHGGLVRR